MDFYFEEYKNLKETYTKFRDLGFHRDFLRRSCAESPYEGCIPSIDNPEIVVKVEEILDDTRRFTGPAIDGLKSEVKVLSFNPKISPAKINLPQEELEMVTIAILNEHIDRRAKYEEDCAVLVENYISDLKRQHNRI